MNVIKKYVLSLTFIACVILSVMSPAFAAQRSRFVDSAGLLSMSDGLYINELLDKISEKYECDVVIMTLKDTGGYDAKDHAEWLYDSNGYGQGENSDGVMLMISMSERDWVIVTTGFCKKAVNRAARNKISLNVVPKLRDGDYADAFKTFANMSEKMISSARAGHVYHPYLLGFFISLGGALMIAYLTISYSGNQLKSVHAKKDADEYIKINSFKLDGMKDTLTHQSQSKIYSPQYYYRRSRHGIGKSKHKRFSGGGYHGSSHGKF